MQCSPKSRLICIAAGLLLGLILAMGCTSNVKGLRSPCHAQAADVTVYAYESGCQQHSFVDELRHRGVKVVLVEPYFGCPTYIVYRNGYKVTQTSDQTYLVALLRWMLPSLMI